MPGSGLLGNRTPLALIEMPFSRVSRAGPRRARDHARGSCRKLWIARPLSRGARDRAGVFQGALVSARTALSPPKAKAFESTASTLASRATLGTTSSEHSGSGSS